MELSYNLLHLKRVKNKVSDLKPSSAENELRVIVVRRIQSKTKGKEYPLNYIIFQLADESGCVLCAFNKDTATNLFDGDILYLLNYSFNKYKDKYLLFEGSKSTTKNIGKYMFPFTLKINKSCQSMRH